MKRNLYFCNYSCHIFTHIFISLINILVVCTWQLDYHYAVCLWHKGAGIDFQKWQTKKKHKQKKPCFIETKVYVHTHVFYFARYKSFHSQLFVARLPDFHLQTYIIKYLVPSQCCALPLIAEASIFSPSRNAGFHCQLLGGRLMVSKLKECRKNTYFVPEKH